MQRMETANGTLQLWEMAKVLSKKGINSEEHTKEPCQNSNELTIQSFVDNDNDCVSCKSDGKPLPRLSSCTGTHPLPADRLEKHI